MKAKKANKAKKRGKKVLKKAKKLEATKPLSVSIAYETIEY
jgi:hypothetical protein